MDNGVFLVFLKQINTRDGCNKHTQTSTYDTVFSFCPFCVDEILQTLFSVGLGSSKGVGIIDEYNLNSSMLVPFERINLKREK